jgi:hypothetical protein
MVGSRRVQSPTPHARALPSVDTYGNSPSQPSGQGRLGGLELSLPVPGLLGLVCEGISLTT